MKRAREMSTSASTRMRGMFPDRAFPKRSKSALVSRSRWGNLRVTQAMGKERYQLKVRMGMLMRGCRGLATGGTMWGLTPHRMWSKAPTRRKWESSRTSTSRRSKTHTLVRAMSP